MDYRDSLTIPQPLVRLSNWITILLIVVAWVIQVPLLIIIPTIYFGLGAFWGKNPIIVVGKKFLNKDKKYMLEDKDQMSFNSLLAFIMLAIALVFFYSGLPVIYYVFTGMCVAANFGAILGFCAGCFIRYQWKQYQYRRAIK